MVSSVSQWEDEIWSFDESTPGSERAAVNWRMEVADGGLLTDDAHSSMLDWLKRFLWSLLAVPGDGPRPLVVGSMTSVAVGLKSVVFWMTSVGIDRLHQVTPERVEEFCDDLADELAENGRPTITQAWLRLRIFVLFWRQRRVLEECGVSPMPRRPFGTKSSLSVARRISSVDVGWVNPVPDEVAVKLLNTAQKFVETQAEWILGQVEASYNAYFAEGRAHHNGPGTSKHTRSLRSRRALANAKSERMADRARATEQGGGEHAELRTNFTDLLGAALCLIQGGTGMRGSEIAAISVGDGQAAELPSCVSVQISPSGLYEIFTLASAVSKGEAGSRKADWVVGMRLRGEPHIPPVVRALQVAERLVAPIRKVTGTKAMFVSLSPGIGLPKTAKGLGRVYSGHLRQWQRTFIERHVDLSDLPDQSRRPVTENDLVRYKETRGRCIRPTQFRKAFATFAVQVSSDLIPALAMHFKHVSHSMTEGGYIGNNPVLLSDRDSLASQRTASLFADLVQGRQRLAGRRGEELSEHREQLRELIQADAVGSRWRLVNRLVTDLGVIGWFHADGTCLPMDPSEMQCHADAGTFPHAGRVMPNFEFRRVSTCSGCKNYLISSENAGFWQQRYKSYRFQLIAQPEETGKAPVAVFARRAQIAAQWLRMLGLDVESLNQQVDQEIKQWRQSVNEQK